MTILYRDGFTKLVAGHYYRRYGSLYAEITRKDGLWLVSVKNYETHAEIRGAGAWKTLDKAKAAAKAAIGIEAAQP